MLGVKPFANQVVIKLFYQMIKSHKKVYILFLFHNGVLHVLFMMPCTSQMSFAGTVSRLLQEVQMSLCLSVCLSSLSRTLILSTLTESMITE